MTDTKKRALEREEEEAEKERKRKKNEKKTESKAAKAAEQNSKQKSWQDFAKKGAKKGVNIPGMVRPGLRQPVRRLVDVERRAASPSSHLRPRPAAKVRPPSPGSSGSV